MSYVLSTHRFRVEWGGVNLGFQEVSGLSHENEVITYIDGTFNDTTAPMKSPGRKKYAESITLKRGYFKGDDQMQEWLEAIRTDNGARRTVIITLLDNQREAVMAWTVHRAWPSKIDGLALSAASSTAAVENITLQHEGYDFEIIS